MTQSPANAPTCAARGAAGRSKRSWLCVVAHLPAAPACPAGAVGRPAAQAGVFSFSLSTFSLSTSVVTFITYQEMAPAVNGTGTTLYSGKQIRSSNRKPHILTRNWRGANLSNGRPRMALIRRSLATEIVNAPAQRRRACAGTNARKHSNATAQASALRAAVSRSCISFLC
jgi:hypothetical protein